MEEADHDFLARAIGAKLADDWKQPVVVENKPGASGIIGIDLVAKSTPDGQTLLLGSVTNVILPSLYDKLPFDALRDFTPVAMLAYGPLLVVVHPSVPVNSVAELIAYAKKNSGKLSYGTAGSGTSVHIAVEMFKKQAGVDIVHTPYKGSGPAMLDLVGGQTQLMMDVIPSALPGIANAIAAQLGGLKGNKGAIAETIENNVRRNIIKEQLSDPAYYETMSALLNEIIAARKAKAIEYEEYLKRIADLAKRVEAGLADDTPEPLKHSPALRALYNNLKGAGGTFVPADRAAEPAGGTAFGDVALEKALKIDVAVKRVRPDGWRGVQARERVIKAALYEILRDHADVERIFLIVKARGEY